MNKKIITTMSGALLLLSLTGCGASQSNTTSQNNTATQQSNTVAQTDKSKDTSMKDMSMSNQQPMVQAFQDELNGFTTIEQDVKKGNYQDAATLANKLHDTFHAAILPPLKEKKGATYAEDIHGKYDELQDAITTKDPAKIANMIKVNRDNLNTVANILGVSIKQ